MTGFLIMGCEEKSQPMRIVCFGDSLTACGGQGGHYSDYLQEWLPKYEVINKGIGGDTLGGGRKRFEKDVLELQPVAVIIELGANDYWHTNRPISELKADLESMVIDAKKSGAEVIIASCFGGTTRESRVPIDPSSKKRQLYAEKIAEFEREISEQYKCYYVPDMQVDILPNGKAPYWDDSNHPNKAGNEFVARRIFNELQKALVIKSR